MIEREIHKLARLAVCLAAVNLCVPMVRATTWTADVGKTRVYYIAADEVEWNYAPSGGDEAMGMPFDAIARGYTESGPHRIGSVYKKAVYREYTDATFTKLKPRAPEDQYLGLIGPIMHAEVGDTIRVVFRNHASHPYGMHPHGVEYTKDSEGADYNDGSAGADKEDGCVPQGGTHVYIWKVTDAASPGPEDPSSIVWLYHSHCDELRDVASGLFGAMIVSRRGMALADGRPKGIGT